MNDVVLEDSFDMNLKNQKGLKTKLVYLKKEKISGKNKFEEMYEIQN